MTKLGPHNLTGNAAGKVLADAGAPIVKMVDTFDPSFARPGVTLIGRRVSTYPADPSRVITAENLRQAHGPEEAAGIWVDVQKATYAANPFITIWEGPNEPAFTDDTTAMQWYGAFETERVRLLAALGLRAAIGCFSYGTPDVRPGHLDSWSAFLPALRAAAGANAILALHEYNDGPLTTSQVDADGTGWLTFRYRKVIRYVLAPNGLGNLPIALTEFGRFNFRQRLTDAAYAADLLAADAEMQKDPTLLGAAIFTCGSNNAAWDPFNIDGTTVPQLLAAGMKAQPTPPPTGGTSMAIDITTLDFSKNYTWDAQAGAPEPGNTISLPQGIGFDYVHDTSVRVRWTDIKTGSPTYGQTRTSDSPFLKPEGVQKAQADAPDIPFPAGVTRVEKLFKGYGPIWILPQISFNATVGSKLKLTWPVWPNLLANDTGGIKVYADDPAAGWLRLRVKAGEVKLAIDPVNDAPGAAWYNGRDFAFGHWFTPQVVIDVTAPVMTVGLECVSIFGLKDSDFMFAPPILEVVQPAGGNNGGSTNPPPVAVTGTLKAALAQLVTDASAAGRIADDVAAVQAIIG